jgi:hypothetical protein
MTSPPRGGGGPALARSLRAMTTGTLLHYNDRLTARNHAAIGEVDRQFQLTFSTTGLDVLDTLGNEPVPYTGGIVPGTGDASGHGDPGPSSSAASAASLDGEPPPALEPRIGVKPPQGGTPTLASTAPELDTNNKETHLLAEMWRTQWLTFDGPFVVAPEDRDTPFEFPIFTYGVALTTGTGIVVVCSVTRWTIDDDRDYVSAAQIEYGAYRPNRQLLGHFVATLNLNFQGWATPDPPDDDAETT